MKNFQKRNQNRKNESGNVLIYILIAVVLFAALSYVVGNMMRGGNASMIGEEQAKLYAGEILDYARIVRGAVQDIRISNGCSDTDIRFVNNITTGYGTSVRTECDVFNAAGGDVKYIAPLDKYGTGTEWIFSRATPIDEIGTSSGGIPSTDLTMVLNDVDINICTEINNKIGIVNPSGAPPIDVGTMNTTYKFSGTYDGASPINSPENEGKMTGCVQNAAQTSNVFYQVLIAR